MKVFFSYPETETTPSDASLHPSYKSVFVSWLMTAYSPTTQEANIKETRVQGKLSPVRKLARPYLKNKPECDGTCL
jgi:hypothetical protein